MTFPFFFKKSLLGLGISAANGLRRAGGGNIQTPNRYCSFFKHLGGTSPDPACLGYYPDQLRGRLQRPQDELGHPTPEIVAEASIALNVTTPASGQYELLSRSSVKQPTRVRN